jgi:hypothetical protein
MLRDKLIGMGVHLVACCRETGSYSVVVEGADVEINLEQIGYITTHWI